MPTTSDHVSRILVTGVPGVGKSTVIQALPTDLRQSAINFGSLMWEHLSEVVDTRDAIRSLSSEELQRTRNDVAKCLPTVCIVDCHLSITKSGVATPGIPSLFCERGFLAGIFLLEADPQTILERRSRRRSRDDAPQRTADIQKQQKYNRELAQDIARRCGCWIYVIDASLGAEVIASDMASRIAGDPATK